MKASRYNNYVEKGDYAYWFNPLYQTYFRLPKTLGKKVYRIINNGSNLKNISQTFYDNLVNNGFLVPKEQDELKVLREKFQSSVESKQAFLIIAPTLNCNYSCWYCIQNHITSIMDADTIERVKKHIKYLIEVDKIESLHIDWFGGEPFMFFEKVIVPIAEYAIEICEKASIPFYNSATTNAYYMNEKISQMLGNLKFRTFQITLDGNREFHDKVKFMKGWILLLITG